MAKLGDGGSVFDATSSGLSLSVGRLELNSQARRQVGFTEPEGLFKEAARLEGKLATTFCGGNHSCERFDALSGSLNFRSDSLLLDEQLCLRFDLLSAGCSDLRVASAVLAKRKTHRQAEDLCVPLVEIGALTCHAHHHLGIRSRPCPGELELSFCDVGARRKVSQKGVDTSESLIGRSGLSPEVLPGRRCTG